MLRRGGIRIAVALGLALALAGTPLGAEGVSPIRRMAGVEPVSGVARLWSQVQEWAAAIWLWRPAETTDPTCDHGPKVDPDGCPKLVEGGARVDPSS